MNLFKIAGSKRGGNGITDNKNINMKRYEATFVPLVYGMRIERADVGMLTVLKDVEMKRLKPCLIKIGEPHKTGRRTAKKTKIV